MPKAPKRSNSLRKERRPRSFRWSGLSHHLLAAATIGAVMVLLDHAGALGWLDAITLRIAQAAQIPVIKNPFEPDPQAADIVEIDSETYDRDFQGRSPLDRAILADLLRCVGGLDAKAATTRPCRNERAQLIVLDIDIAPASCANAKVPDVAECLGLAANDPVESVLRQLIAAKTRVVVPVPSMSRTYNARAWMQRACAAKIEFGFVTIDEHFGVVTRVPVDVPTLAAVAADMETDRKPVAHGQILCQL